MATCSECHSDALMGFIVFAVVTWGLLLGLYMLNLSINDSTSPNVLAMSFNRGSYMRHNVVLGVMKVLISHFQIVGLLLLVKVDWEKFLGTFFSFAQAFSVSGLDWADCLLKSAGGDLGDDGSSTYATGLIVLSLPLILGLFLVLVFFIVYTLDRDSVNPTTRKEYWGRLYVCLLVLMMLLNVLFIRTGLNFFACTEDYYSTLPEDVERPSTLNVLVSEPFIACTGDSYYGWAYGLGLICLVLLYGVGTIVYTAFLVARVGGISSCCRSETYGHTLPERLNRWRPKWGVLYRCFRGQYYYWTVVENLIMFSFVACLVLMQLQGAMQLFSGLLISAIALLFQFKIQPYRAKEVNNLKLWSLVTIFLSFALGAFLIPENGLDTGFGYGDRMNYQSLSALLLALHIWYILYSFLVILDIYTMDQDGQTAESVKSCLRVIRWKRSSGDKQAEKEITENSRKVEMIDEMPQSQSFKDSNSSPPSSTEYALENGQPAVGGASTAFLSSNTPNREMKPLKSALKTNGKYSYYDAVTANSERLTLNSERVELEEEEFFHGERIRITNLSKMQEFNGKEGSFREFFPEKRRYEVLLDDGSILRIRRKHFIRLSNSGTEPQAEPAPVNNKVSDSYAKAPSTDDKNLAQELERMNQILESMKKENSSLKKEVKYLDGLNTGMIDGYGKTS
eukprot:CAMPEP_0204829496 /NCGR_PEP_ID=MMETSP1346-20131115/7700_1 /ASSEMBLY_ACC=CAM_ASM_000771 /TAXON_ID=215587 /ORGANISM="Aplanochytrium stocchinoi, Strain GSBS06" /LENGTH=678 /DNA_ID=CAMNT_0051959349 /DNA_START=237 /DNA_END=2273 /DNA_ORIENTATION=-